MRARDVSEVKQYPSGSGQKSTAKVITAKFLLPLAAPRRSKKNANRPLSHHGDKSRKPTAPLLRSLFKKRPLPCRGGYYICTLESLISIINEIP